MKPLSAPSLVPKLDLGRFIAWMTRLQRTSVGPNVVGGIVGTCVDEQIVVLDPVLVLEMVLMMDGMMDDYLARP